MSSSSLSIPYSSNYWRDIERVIVLNKMIEEADIYSEAPSPAKWVEFFQCGGVCFPRSQFAGVFDTSQLQFLLSLEKELDAELLKPLENSLNESRQPSVDSAAMIFKLEKRISELNVETDYILDLEHHEDCSTKYSFPMSTNILLLKHILEIRLEREKRNQKTQNNGFTYGSISKPSVDFSHEAQLLGEEEEAKRRLEKWKKDLFTLKSANPYARATEQNSVSSYLKFVYKMTKEQDLKTKIKSSTLVNETDPPPYSN